MTASLPIVAATWVTFIIELGLLILWITVSVFKCNFFSATRSAKDAKSVKSKTGDAPSMNSGNSGVDETKGSGPSSGSGTTKVSMQIHDYKKDKSDKSDVEKDNASSEAQKRADEDPNLCIQNELSKQQAAIHISVSFTVLVGLSIFWGVVCNVTPLIIHFGALYDHPSYCVIASIPTMFLSRFFMVWFFLKRIEISFLDTPLAYSQRSIKAIRFALFTSYPLVVSFYFIFRVAVQCDPNRMMIAIILTVFNDFGWSIFLLQLFVRKLRQLLRFNDSIKELRYLVTKQTILVCVAIVSTILLLFVFAVTRVPATVTVDIVINSICLVLSFMFSDTYYRNMCILCRKCTVNG